MVSAASTVITVLAPTAVAAVSAAAMFGNNVWILTWVEIGDGVLTKPWLEDEGSHGLWIVRRLHQRACSRSCRLPVARPQAA